MKKKETEFLTEEEAAAILRIPDRRTLQGKRDYSIILTLLTTGLRKAELCSLKLEDLKTYRSQAVVDVVGKGDRFRRLPLKGETLLAIQDYLKASKNGTDPDHALFETLGKHGPYEQAGLTAKAVDCLVKTAAQRALIRKRIHPHVMRHTFERMTLTVIRSKNGEKRTIPLNLRAFELLDRKFRTRPMKTGFVFPSQAWTMLSKYNVDRAFRNAVRKAEIVDFHFHDLRHTFATRLVQAGKDLYKVQKLLGHKTAAMTQRYAHHYPESLRDAVAVLDGDNGGSGAGQTVLLKSQFGHSKQKGATLTMGNSLN